MGTTKKAGRYNRVHSQIEELLHKTDDPISKMATINAILHHKMDHFFWTGFYLIHDGQLRVGPYQGPVACQILEKNKGVCWSAINGGKTIIVPDVEKFSGHIACDSRSKSEIAIPIKDEKGMIIGVLDVDSQISNNFDDEDAAYLEKITTLIFNPQI